MASSRGPASSSRPNAARARRRRPSRATPLRDLNDVRPDPANANRGTARGRTLLDASLRTYGAGRSVLVDRDGTVIAGNKTVEQARAQGLPIAVVQTDGSRLVVVQRLDLDLGSDPRARALAVADNRIGELDLVWDVEQLKAHLAEGFDLSGFWREDEWAALVGEPSRPGLTAADAVPPLRPTTLARGDLVTLGRHRLLCGDATDAGDVARLLDGAHPALMTTDPPYGDSYNPAWRVAVDGGGRHALGAVVNDDRVDWRAAFALFPGAVAYVWHAGLHAAEVAEALGATGFALRAQIIWRKQHFALSRGDYHWQHEPCWYAVRRGGKAHWRGGRTQTTVWDVPNLNPHGGDLTGVNRPTGHATQKPVELFARTMRHHTREGDAVYEPFAGSGSCLIAAEQTGRTCYALEIDPGYVQVICDRWAAFTGQTPVREA